MPDDRRSGRFMHPETGKARKLTDSAAEKNGKFAGTIGNPGNYKEIFNMGYRFLNACSDTGITGKALLEIAKKPWGVNFPGTFLDVANRFFMPKRALIRSKKQQFPVFMHKNYAITLENMSGKLRQKNH